MAMAIEKPGSIAKVRCFDINIFTNLILIHALLNIQPVQMKLATPKPTTTTKKLSVASAFSNIDSDDEVEEMPAECRMRMRNIGRYARLRSKNTATAADSAAE